MKPRISVVPGYTFPMWQCAMPEGEDPKPTGIGLSVADAYGRWRDRYFTGVSFAAFGVPDARLSGGRS
jgi:hypothetical protein